MKFFDEAKKQYVPVSVTNPLPTSAGAGGEAPLKGNQFAGAIGTPDDDTVVTDPEATEATVIGLLRGILAEQKAQTALLTTIAENTEPTP